MTVSPRKKSLVVGRLRPSTKSAKDSPPQDEWLAAESFQFTDSPSLSRKGASRRSGRASSTAKNATQQKRRQSVLLKRLDLPADLVSTSPNMRRTRRQSMGHLPRKKDTLQESSKTSRLPRAVSEKTVKNKNSHSKLPLPSKRESTRAVKAEDKPEAKTRSESEVVISPQKFYTSPEKKSRALRRKSFGMAALEENIVTETRAKRKAEPAVSVKKTEEPQTKKRKGKSSVSKLDATQASPTAQKAKKSDEAETKTSSSPAHLRSLKSPSTKKSKKAELKSPSPAPKEVEPTTPPSTSKKAKQTKVISSLKKRKKSGTPTASPVPKTLSKLGDVTPAQSPKVRLTRSVARSSQRVRLVGVSPSPSATTFRKTPKSGKKEVTISTDDMGSSPALSARLHLQLLRCNSPLADKRKISSAKVKPFTPKPDPPPRSLLKQTMKKKVAKNIKATTKVEVHRLMDPEISTTKKITKGEEQLIPVTPVSVTNLPPTPKSSRKTLSSSVSRRSALRSTADIVPCPRPSSPETPRSSTPIDKEDELDDLTVDPAITTFSQEEEEVSIEDTSKDDAPETESPEKTKRSYCTLM
ncbi:serine/arginine repetitive matrix protein 1-like isoform X2 [Penaeus japonicus]|nr:serine/arginine repetitive matrix protein 1-like isoform X2 [Penaeus japonicus]XP_042885927.1 serine/arginine repetitive matrix protein 1-like isoform X2 [Penaeus japonicus]